MLSPEIQLRPRVSRLGVLEACFGVPLRGLHLQEMAHPKHASSYCIPNMALWRCAPIETASQIKLSTALTVRVFSPSPRPRLNRFPILPKFHDMILRCDQCMTLEFFDGVQFDKQRHMRGSPGMLSFFLGRWLCPHGAHETYSIAFLPRRGTLPPVISDSCTSSCNLNIQTDPPSRSVDCTTT